MSVMHQVKRGISKFLWKERLLIPVTIPTDQRKILSGKRALIAGGTGQIGLCIAEELSRFGCDIVIGGTNEKKLDEIKIYHRNENWGTCVLDYSDADILEEQIEHALDSFGLCNYFISSAGVHTENVDFYTVDSNEFDRVININLKGTFFAARKIIKTMIDYNETGSIVLISSSRGLEPAWSPYGVSKWGLHGLTLGLAQMCAEYGITVNAIAPGTTATSLIGYTDGDSISSGENRIGRMATAEEVASFTRSIIIEGSPFMTGEIISFSGGRGRFDIR